MKENNKLGLTQNTSIEERVKKNFLGETGEVGLYLAMSRQAQENGFPEVAIILEQIAWEEAVHASRFAEMNGMISPNIRENIENMLGGEQGASAKKYDAAMLAKDSGIEWAHAFFIESSEDERRHANMLQGILNRYFFDT